MDRGDHVKRYILIIVSCASACGQAAPSTSGSGGSFSVASSAESSGSGGAAPCAPGTKRCGSACVAIDAPSTGCAAPSCDACSYANGVAICAAGACALASCVKGWEDCDSDPANGCEAHTVTDPNHCGACANKCSFPHAEASCENGTCVPGPCLTDYADCDNVSGCETHFINDTQNCGACAFSCASGDGCSNGTCYSCNDLTTCVGAANQTVSNGTIIAWPYVATNSLAVSAIEVNVSIQSSLYVMSDIGGMPGQVLAIHPLVAGGSMGWMIANVSPSVSFIMQTTYWIGVSGSNPRVCDIGSVPSFRANVIGGSPGPWLTNGQLTPLAIHVIGACL